MKIAWLLIACGTLHAQTTRYPTALDSDSSLFFTADNIQSPLTASMQPSDTAVVIQSGTGFAANMIVSICDTQTSTGKCTSLEHMLVTAVNGNVLTVTRAFAGTTAKPHTNGKLVSALIAAAHHNTIKDAAIAIETALGPNLSKIIGTDSALARTVMATYWNPQPVLYNVMGTVSSANPGGDVPVAGFTSWMRQNANRGDAVSVMSACEVNVPNGACFGMNIVLGTNGNLSGATNPGLVGIEVDIEPYYQPSAGSVAMSAVMYNVQNPAPAFLVRNGNYAVTPPAWAIAYKSEDGATITALYAGSRGLPTGSPVNQNSQNIIFHSVNGSGVDRNSEMFADVTGKLVLNFAGIQSGSAIKVAQIASCTTAATVGATCNTTVNWGSAFADTSYFPLCSIAAGSGAPYILNEQSGHTTSSSVIQIAALTANAATGTLSCVAIHN